MPIYRSESERCDVCDATAPVAVFDDSANPALRGAYVCRECLGDAINAVTGLKLKNVITYAIAQSEASAAVRAERLAAGQKLTRTMERNLAEKSR